MTFKWFNPTEGMPKISIAKYGLTLHKKALLALKNPIYVKLGIDKNNRLIAIKRFDNSDDETINLKHHKQSYARINNKDFINLIESTFNLDLGKETISYNAICENNTLIINLGDDRNENSY
jgi:hypothetical protein